LIDEFELQHEEGCEDESSIETGTWKQKEQEDASEVYAAKKKQGHASTKPFEAFRSAIQNEKIQSSSCVCPASRN
jgi:hypothetical protein